MSGSTLFSTIVTASNQATPNHNNKKQLHFPTLGADVRQSFQDISKNRVEYVIYRLSEDETEIQVEHSPPIGTSGYDELLTLLPSQDPRWVLLNIHYTTVSGGKRCKTTLFSWVPDTLTRSSMKESARIKMQAVTTFGILKAALKGQSSFSVEADNVSDLTYSEVLARVSRFELDPIAF